MSAHINLTRQSALRHIIAIQSALSTQSEESQFENRLSLQKHQLVSDLIDIDTTPTPAFPRRDINANINFLTGTVVPCLCG